MPVVQLKCLHAGWHEGRVLVWLNEQKRFAAWRTIRFIKIGKDWNGYYKWHPHLEIHFMKTLTECKGTLIDILVATQPLVRVDEYAMLVIEDQTIRD